MNIDNELELVTNVTQRFNPQELSDADKASIRELVSDIKPEVADLSTDQALSELFGMASLHPNAHVRYYMLDVARDHETNVFAQEFIAQVTHDDEDFVAFEALRACRDLNLQRAIDDLISISHWPSERLETGKKPVGVGHAMVLDAALDVFGTSDPDELAELEAFYREHGHLPVDQLYNPALESRESTDDPGPAPDGMVLVPGGTYVIGVEESRLPMTRFDDTDFTTPYEVEVGPFYIDKYPVTVAEYDEFVAEIEDCDHKYCHPGEPDGKDHRRNTRYDDRTGPDHPATGIDYYDAYAYAKWAGKDLPFEEEWEIAARGESGHVFPWGDEWHPDRLNWAGYAFDEHPDDLSEWRELLVSADRMASVPETLTTPVDAFPENESEFGVVDMVGNVWEYTKTNFYSRQEMHPVFRHTSRKAHIHLVDDEQAFPVIRGGAWSSIPEMTSGPYRGKDLMTDRHNEIGFRCVKRV